MRLHRLRLTTAALSVLWLALGADVSALSDNCATLSDADSKFSSSMAQLANLAPEALSTTPAKMMLASVDMYAPWLSQCIANVDVLELVSAAMASEELGQCIQNMESGQTPVDMEFSNELFRDYLCPTITDTLIPCLNNVLLPLIDDTVARAGGCCDGFYAEMDATFGYSLLEMIPTFSELVGNVICATKTTQSGAETTTETCGYSLSTSLYSAEEDDPEQMSFMKAYEVPESGVCAAVNGEPFISTTGTLEKFENYFPDYAPYGVCYTTMQDLLAYVATFPVWNDILLSNGQLLADLLNEDTCVSGEYLVEWLLVQFQVIADVQDVFYAIFAPVGESIDSQSSSDVDDVDSVDASQSGASLYMADGSGDASSEGEWVVVLEYDSESYDSSVDSSSNDLGSDSSDDGSGMAWLSPLELLQNACFHLPFMTQCDYPEQSVSLVFMDVGSGSGRKL
ncbi:hypothetical protein BBJ28_00017660 [Nothophytophthora sp. Chile5]|nr:hypothetical protein BBJ28_00017660 [Nothophytophthora sp. Chile5]